MLVLDGHVQPSKVFRKTNLSSLKLRGSLLVYTEALDYSVKVFWDKHSSLCALIAGDKKSFYNVAMTR